MTDPTGPTRPCKDALLAELLNRVRTDLTTLTRTQEATHAAATHAESRAEHAKDTRATEQSYLARGLAERVETLRHSEKLLSQLSIRSFGPADPIQLTALVILHDDQTDAKQSWLLVPSGGGLQLRSGRVVVRTITPAAPLGRALIGLHIEDEGNFQTPGGRRSFRVLCVA